MTTRLTVGLDIGGTSIKAGLISGKAKVIARAEEPNLNKGPQEAKKQILGLIERIWPSRKNAVNGIGVGAPGPLDLKKGILLRSPNIAGWVNLPLVSWVTQKFKQRVVMDNDANAAALAESLWGAGRKHRYVFYATLSTGIGTGFVINKKIYGGRTGKALEGGHLTIDHNGVRCKCGLIGCIEAYASGPALARRAAVSMPQAKDREITPKEIEKLAQKGDVNAQRLIAETGEYLGLWLGNIVNLLEPDIIILGGGLTNFGPFLFNPIKKTMPQRSIIPDAKDIPIVRAQLKDDVGILGAAALLTQKN